MNDRPLAHLILTRTGQDVRECQACHLCDDLLADGMDVPFGELLRLAAVDDRRALTCSSLWCCEPLLSTRLCCQAGLDIPAVVRALRDEALHQGLGPPPTYPEMIL
jgi:hypothetical protein